MRTADTSALSRESASKTAASTSMSRRAALSAFLGSTVEYYDFFLFGTASALVFGNLFFDPLGSAGGLLASLATFGVAYLARPLGAVVFGNLGDLIGRKRTLTLVLNIMGLSTFLIAFLPGYSTIGVLAPILLVILRLAQGLSAGGEQAGSNALSVEHAPEGRRGLYASWSMQGTVAGMVLSSVAFIAASSLPHELFVSWGWRVPFAAAGPLMAVALYVRSRIAEPASFTRTTPADRTSLPVKDLITTHWRPLLRVVCCNLMSVISTTLSVYALSFATHTVGISARAFLFAGIIGNLVCLVLQPCWARLSDRVGRRPIMTGTLTMVAVLWVPYFAGIASGNICLVVASTVLLMLFFSGANGVQASFYTEQFPAAVRYTGTAVGMQLGILISGFTPLIQASLAGEGRNGWVAPAAFAAALCLIAAVSAWTARETSTVQLDRLDVAVG